MRIFLGIGCGIAALGFLALSSCTPRAPEAVLETTFAGLNARYQCLAPPSSERCAYIVAPDTKPRGLILALHPAFHNPEATEQIVQFAPRAVAAGYAVAYPEGIDRQWNDGRHAEAAETFRRKTDDVAFLEQLALELQHEYHLHAPQTLAAGMSNGGMMAQRLACETDAVGAVASVAANLPSGLAARCNAIPKPMLLVFGSEDDVVPFAGGALAEDPKDWGEVLSAEATIAHFARKNGCANPARKTINRKDDGTVARTERYHCKSASLEAIVTQGMGHTWPNEPSDFRAWITTRGRISRELDGTDLVLAFARKAIR
jgi:polyhydroxybutyrate depolymerase